MLKIYRETPTSYAYKLLDELEEEELWAIADILKHNNSFSDLDVFGPGRTSKIFWANFYKRVIAGKKVPISRLPLKYFVTALAYPKDVKAGLSVSSLRRRVPLRRSSKKKVVRRRR